MLKKIVKKRMILMAAVLFAVSLMYFLPKEKLYTLDAIKEEVTYVDEQVNKEVIYMLDKNNMLGRTEVVVNQTEIVNKAKELLEILINDSKSEDKIPNGFKGILPSDTKINSLTYDNKMIKVDFSKELLEDVKAEEEEHIIEAIVYTVTSISDIKSVIIYMEGDIVNYLPKSKITLPATLDRNFGINKEYDIKDSKDINQVTIYYVDEYNGQISYVPVTKYMNDKREKIDIIIDELSSAPLYHSNLMSFLNQNVKLLANKQEEDSLFLTFNQYILNDMNERNILEEVIYTISLSVAANYDVKEVIFQVDDQEIYKSVIKTIENS